MKSNRKQVVAMATGFLAGAVVAYRIVPGDALALLAIGSAVAAGACVGLFSDPLFAVSAGSEPGRKQAKAARGDSRDFLQTIIDGIPDVTMVINRERQITLANRAAREMGGGEDPVSSHLTCHQFSHHSDVPCRAVADSCPLTQVVETKKPARVTHTHYDADDKEIVVEVHATPVFDDAGEVVEMIEACRDVTRPRHAGIAPLAG